MSTLKTSGTDNGYLMESAGEMLGHPLYTQPNITASRVVFGNFRDFAQVRTWGDGSLDLIVDPYSKAANRITRITVSLMADIAIVRQAAFCING